MGFSPSCGGPARCGAGLTIPICHPQEMGPDFWGMQQTDKRWWFGILALMVVSIA